jgi:XTP/dITP diphosphohydrolase/ATP diphosphatase
VYVTTCAIGVDLASQSPKPYSYAMPKDVTVESATQALAAADAQLDRAAQLNLAAQGAAAASLQRSAAIMALLRSPQGCPWDREQSFDSIKKHTLEETYEVFDAIERRAWPELKDELGDLLLQVLFYAQMATEAGYFTLQDVADNLNAKLVRRHPHIFSDVKAADAGTVLRNWEQIKLEEKKAHHAASDRSLLEDVPRTMPATMEAEKLGSKAAKVGFDWPDAQGIFDKVAEEMDELRVEIQRADREKIEAEFGDLLFTAINLARHLRVDAESALRRTNAKFRERFAAMEAAAGGIDALRAMQPEALEALWSAAKRKEMAE